MKSTGSYPRVHVDTAKVTAVGQAGGILLTETIRAAGLDRALSEALSRWRKPLAVHDPGKIICDLAVSLVLGGEALSDIATLRAEPGVYGPVASDPTVSRLIAALAEDADKAIKAIAGARQQARARAWALAGEHAPDHESTAEDPVIIDLDASLITAHSADAARGCDVEDEASGSTRCWRSPTTDLRAPAKPWRSTYAPGTPARTPRLITSPSPNKLSRSSPTGTRGPDAAC